MQVGRHGGRSWPTFPSVRSRRRCGASSRLRPGPKRGRPRAHYAAEAHTLAEIHDIARQVGIPADNIDRAVGNLDGPARVEPPASRFLVFDLTLHEERVLARALSDDEMRHLTRQTERVANRPGTTQQKGNWVEWRDRKERLYVGVVRSQGKTHVRIIADHTREFVAGAGVIGLIGVGSALQLDKPACPGI